MSSEEPAADVAEDPWKPTRFRFKRKRESDQDEHPRHSRQRHHPGGRRRRDKQPEVNDDPSAYDDSVSNLPPDVAFRESLFDAMGDDEGAEFWQGVYGQPIHDYPNAFSNEETGELERLNDEEYATYVRRKMWERSREGIEAAREEKQRQDRQDREARKHRTEAAPAQQRPAHSRHDFVFDLEIEESLKRGEQRKEKKKWRALWQTYLQRWSELQSLSGKQVHGNADVQPFHLRDMIPWPVESGKRHDLDMDHIENFLRKCAETDQPGPVPETFRNMLKAERIRFHPDKIQQRYGFMDADQDTMQGVTAVFQVLDQMWNKERGR